MFNLLIEFAILSPASYQISRRDPSTINSFVWISPNQNTLRADFIRPLSTSSDRINALSFFVGGMYKVSNFICECVCDPTKENG